VRHDNYNSPVLDISRTVYERSLVCYPKDLRDDFGSEMMEVFDEQVSDAYSSGGYVGILRVWFSAMREIVTVALPGRFAERAIPIVAVTVTSAFMLWFASYIGYVMEKACSGCATN
jgi:hypothetical protein